MDGESNAVFTNLPARLTRHGDRLPELWRFLHVLPEGLAVDGRSSCRFLKREAYRQPFHDATVIPRLVHGDRLPGIRVFVHHWRAGNSTGILSNTRDQARG